MRTSGMPGNLLRVGDIITEEGRRWRVAKQPVPEILPDNRIRWVVPVDAIEGGDLPSSYHHVAFFKYGNCEWLVQF